MPVDRPATEIVPGSADDPPRQPTSSGDTTSPSDTSKPVPVATIDLSVQAAAAGDFTAGTAATIDPSAPASHNVPASFAATIDPSLTAATIDPSPAGSLCPTIAPDVALQKSKE